MMFPDDDHKERALSYAKCRGYAISRFGFGEDGTVFRSNFGSAIKVYGRERSYCIERDVYSTRPASRSPWKSVPCWLKHCVCISSSWVWARVSLPNFLSFRGRVGHQAASSGSARHYGPSISCNQIPSWAPCCSWPPTTPEPGQSPSVCILNTSPGPYL